VALLAYPLGESIGTGAKAITADFAGDTLYTLSRGSATLTVNKGDTAISRFPRTGRRGQTVTLAGRLSRLGDRAFVVGRTVTIKVEGVVVGTGVTGADGVASVPYLIPATLSLGDHPFTVEFAGDDLYNATSITSTLTVQ
jgi:hypothetical protein